MKRSNLMVGFVALALAGCYNAATDSALLRPAQVADAVITAADIHNRIAYLASDEMEGRDTPSRGLEAAAAWIADEFRHFGLEPGAADGWMQRYPFHLEGLDAGETRIEISGGATHALDYGTDFFAHPGTARRHSVGVVYVADPQELAREPGSSLADRAVIVRLRARPESARGGARFNSQTRAAIDEAVARALHAGATSVLFALDEQVERGEIRELARTAETPTRAFGGRDTERPAIFFLHHQAAQRMFRMAGLDGPELLRVDRLDRPVPLPGITVNAAAPLTALDRAEPPNVVGVLRGGDPVLRDTYLVISAHMDHVGIGTPDASGDSIYNGADDNASGTAALMAIARAFTSLPEAPARSVIFLAVSGEEKGLLGSRWFADHPTVPLDQIVGNINIDMIGRNAPDSIVAIGKEYSSLGPLARDLAAANPQLGLTVSTDLWPGERFFFRSDHFSFAAKEIPAIFFFAGTHEDYHRPGDRVERIDADKAARVARLAFLLALEVAQREEPPAWAPGGLEQVRTMTAR
jgi:hypothetical protein